MKTKNKEIDIAQVVDESFVTIPAGTVQMRDDRIKETWSVNVESFELSRFLVTQDIYTALTKENPSQFNGDRLPVETVSWIDAVSFCNKLSEFSGKDKCYTLDLENKGVT
ncbi:MAG: SUMF1/EgtB/PvdO family nonheme iron enzyme, partial [Bacteroidota bacterium]